MGSPLAKNNAFGTGSPSWNLSFPSGNLTAAEILAYLPHWLKSVDVVDRFITNGGKSYTIAAMINEFRYQPGEGDGVFRPNSAQIMMSYGMRRAGYQGWTVGTHTNFDRPNPQMRETDLDVRTFRTPRETHPKSAPNGQIAQNLKHNEEAEPIEFRALALHVRKHPFGSDALDLTRCIQYAITHPKEAWYFPNDFEILVNKLDGPAAVTYSHLDRQVFSRRENYVFPSPTKSTPKPKHERASTRKRTGSRQVMPQSRRFKSQAATPTSGSPLKRIMDAEGRVQIAGLRKSGRLVNKASANLPNYDSDASDTDRFDSPRSGYSTPSKKRKLSRIPPTPGTPSNDSDFIEDGSDANGGISEVEVVSDDELFSPIKAVSSRAAARKARRVIRSISTETQRNIEALEQQKPKDIRNLSCSPQKPQMFSAPIPMPSVKVSPDMMSLARTFTLSSPIYLKPPVLSANRLRVDSSTIFLYASEGCASFTEMWASALSSTRFQGPRRHPPFRELHRLTDPLPDDVSNWAENIRWAKEQYSRFRSETWTEYDYHLELITSHRRAVLWVSEEAIGGRR